MRSDSGGHAGAALSPHVVKVVRHIGSRRLVHVECRRIACGGGAGARHPHARPPAAAAVVAGAGVLVATAGAAAGAAAAAAGAAAATAGSTPAVDNTSAR